MLRYLRRFIVAPRIFGNISLRYETSGFLTDSDRLFTVLTRFSGPHKNISIVSSTVQGLQMVVIHAACHRVVMTE